MSSVLVSVEFEFYSKKFLAEAYVSVSGSTAYVDRDDIEVYCEVTGRMVSERLYNRIMDECYTDICDRLGEIAIYNLEDSYEEY